MNYFGNPALTKNPFVCSFIFLPALLLASLTGFAQKKSGSLYAKDTAGIVQDVNLTIEEKLVKLAWAGPQLLRSDAQNKMNEYQIKKTQQSWLNLLTVSTTYNFSNQLNKTDNNGNNVFVAPGMNLGITVPFGIIFSKATDVKIHRETLKQSQFNQDVLARDIKADVLSKWLQYKAYTQMIIIQKRVVDDEQAAYNQVEKKFRENGTSIEVYNNASKTYNNELMKLMNTQLSQDQLKLQIEAIIGASLDEVIAKSKSTK